jgi:hypothetical protein
MRSSTVLNLLHELVFPVDREKERGGRGRKQEREGEKCEGGRGLFQQVFDFNRDQFPLLTRKLE